MFIFQLSSLAQEKHGREQKIGAEGKKELSPLTQGFIGSVLPFYGWPNPFNPHPHPERIRPILLPPIIHACVKIRIIHILCEYALFEFGVETKCI